MRRILHIAVLILMVSLVGTYFYLNAYKFGITKANYQNFSHGRAAPEIELLFDDETIIRHRLRSSDIFDVTGQHQLSFYQLTQTQYENIKAHANELRLSVDGAETPYTLDEQGRALKLVWADRKLVLVREGDMRTIAINVWQDNVRHKGVVECFGKALCQSIQVGGEGWDQLEGPYLDNEESILRRGMPRGRWLYGPESRIVINSRVATDVIMAINILGLMEGMKLSVEGPIVAAKPIPATPYTRAYEGLALYPQASLLKVRLKPGMNTIALKFSQWHQPNAGERRPLAAYLTAVKIKPAG